MPSTRRAILTAGSTALLTALAGCSVLTDDREQIPVELRNDTETTHDVSVRVRRMDDALLNASTTLEPSETATYRFPNPRENTTVTVDVSADPDREANEQVDVGPSAGTEVINITLQPDGDLAIGIAVQ